MKYLIVCFYFMTGLIFHGGHIAEYYFHLEGQNLYLKFSIEKEELLNFKFNKNCDIQSMTALCTAQYLSEHSSITINGRKVEMELQKSYTKDDHLIIDLKTFWGADPIIEFSIQNNCFYEFDPDFKNRIIMDVAHLQKSYLMNKKQNKIELK